MKFQILIIFLILLTLINIELSFGEKLNLKTCPEDLKIFLKKSNGEIVCVKSSSIEKLINRGWGTSVLGNFYNSENPLNIILILTDDQRWDTICVDGIKNAICDNLEEFPMPNIQNELVDKGFVFTNAHVTNPLCCPARASFLSGGFYSHNTGILHNHFPNGGAGKLAGYGENEKMDDLTIATVLQENGYKTALIGKYMNGYYEINNNEENFVYVPPGWDDFIVINERGKTWTYLNNTVIGHNGTFEKIDEISNLYVGEYEKLKSLNFIKNNCNSDKCEKPFFLLLSTVIPHSPSISNPNFPEDRDFVSDFTYRERGWNEGLRCDTKEMPDISDKTELRQKMLSKSLLSNINKICDGKTPPLFLEPLTIDNDEFVRNQLSALRSLDRSFIDIYNELKEMNLLDQTVIIFTSDSGFLWGEHGIWKKQRPYEESIRVPLIIRLPTEEHKIVNDLVAFDIDLAPTILELAGIKHELIEKSDGMSLLPILKHSSEFSRDELQFESFDNGVRVFPWKFVSWAAMKIFIEDETGNRELWKYIEYTEGGVELYNLNHDEFELDSLHKERLDLVEKISQKLDKIKGLSIVSSNFPDPVLNYLPPAVNGQNYNFQLNSWGGNGNNSWSFYTAINPITINMREIDNCEKTNIPSWVNLTKFQTSGIISGIPSWESEENIVWDFCVQVKSDGNSLHPKKNTQSHVKRLQIIGTQK